MKKPFNCTQTSSYLNRMPLFCSHRDSLQIFDVNSGRTTESRLTLKKQSYIRITIDSSFLSPILSLTLFVRCQRLIGLSRIVHWDLLSAMKLVNLILSKIAMCNETEAITNLEAHHKVSTEVRALNT
jgi:hypothetical protein